MLSTVYKSTFIREDLYMDRLLRLDAVVGAVSCHKVGLGVSPPSDDHL